MSQQSTILAGRRFNEALMTDTCTIGVYIESVSASFVTTFALSGTAHYSGPCRVKSVRATVVERDMPGETVSVQELVLCIPVGAGGSIAVDDFVTITAVDAAVGDSSRVGQRYRIRGLAAATYASEMRFPIEAVA